MLRAFLFHRTIPQNNTWVYCWPYLGKYIDSTGTYVSLYSIHYSYVLVLISYVARRAYVLELAFIASALGLPKETNEHLQLYEQGGSSLKRGVKWRGEIAKWSVTSHHDLTSLTPKKKKVKTPRMYSSPIFLEISYSVEISPKSQTWNQALLSKDRSATVMQGG